MSRASQEKKTRFPYSGFVPIISLLVLPTPYQCYNDNIIISFVILPIVNHRQYTIKIEDHLFGWFITHGARIEPSPLGWYPSALTTELQEIRQ